MTDRDTFAAAALIGLLAGRETGNRPMTAYAFADAMLRQRGTAVSDDCVAGNQPEIPCPVTEPMPVVLSGSGSVTPVPYAKHDEKRVYWHTAGGKIHDAVPEAKAAMPSEVQASAGVSGTGNTPEPVAWAVVYPNNEVAVIAFKRQDAEERASASDRIVPLYRQPQPTLTDAEREAVDMAIDLLNGVEDVSAGASSRADAAAATLRGLLSRLA